MKSILKKNIDIRNPITVAIHQHKIYTSVFEKNKQTEAK